MTAPSTIKRREWGRGHRYTIDGVKVPGVTTVLNALAKPALIDWAANITAEYALDNWDDLERLTPSGRLTRLKQARWAENKRATEAGKRVHVLAERLVSDEEVDVPDDLAGHVESYVRFLDEWQPLLLLSEAVVARRTAPAYCGTLDLMALLPNGQRWLFDVKTGKGIYGETGLQLAAYADAEVWLDGEGVERPMPQVDEIAAIHVRADGYSVHTFPDRAELTDTFLHLAQVWQGTQDMREWVSGEVPVPV